MSEGKITPLPWALEVGHSRHGPFCTIATDREDVAYLTLNPDHVVANAAFIVKAANSHEALKEALLETLAFAEALEKHSSKGTGGRRGGHIFAKARAALSQVGD